MSVSMDRSDLKRQKEAFVSNLEGTTKWEIFCVIGCLPLCLIFGGFSKGWLHPNAHKLNAATHMHDAIPQRRWQSTGYTLD